jgi:glycerol kinase
VISLASMELLLALDAGTTGVRAVAFNVRGEPVDSAYRELSQSFPEPGWVEHSPAEIADLAVAVLREVAVRMHHAGHSFLALGITNQRETTVAWDRTTGHCAYPAIVWQDRRTAGLCESLKKSGHEPHVRNTTGLVLDSYFSASKMNWLLERGLLDSAEEPALATVDTWLVWWLSGGIDGGVFVTEPSNASRTSLMDLDTLDWSPAMLSLFGVDSSLLAPIRPSTTNFGQVSPEVLPELAHVPITGILGDQQAALFGQACYEPGTLKATYGTGSFILANVGDSSPGVFDGLITTVGWDLGAFGPATYAVEGSAFVAGAAIQWLRDELQIISSSAEIGPLAESVSDSGGVSVVPAFSGLGSPFWRSDARGSLTGLTGATTPAHIARAVVESLAYQVRAMTDAFGANNIGLQEIRADGGAGVMDLLLQLQATHSRLPVLRSTSLEATARGAALVAGLECGAFHSLEELASLWTYEKRFEPQDPTFLDPSYQAWLRAVARA